MLDPRWGLRPEICWIASNPTLMGPRGVGTLTGMHAGIAGPGRVITGDGTNGNGVTINGGDKTARDAATFVVVCRRNGVGGEYHGLISLTGHSGGNQGIYVADNGSGNGLGIVRGGVTWMSQVSDVPSDQWLVVVASWRKADGANYVGYAPLGGGTKIVSEGTHAGPMLGGNGTYCVGRVRGDLPSWPGDIAAAVASFDWLGLDRAVELMRNPWQLFAPKRIWVPGSAGGTAHDGTGALSSDASTLSGTATHLTLHASSGALSSDASTIAGSANHIVVHPSSGALSSQDATLAGTALRYRQFSATGALDSASATIAGDAAHTTTGTFSATGALSAQDGTIAGTATHLTLHTATGAIQASDSTITGTAARLGTHDATGSLSADLASITGTVLHTGDGAEVVPLRTGGHAFMRERFAQARKRLALQRILSYLTEEEPAEETKRIIRAVKAGKPIQDKKPPVVMAEVSAEKIAEKLIPSRVADLAEIPDIDMQAVIKKAIRLAQERDDEDVLLLL